VTTFSTVFQTLKIIIDVEVLRGCFFLTVQGMKIGIFLDFWKLDCKSDVACAATAEFLYLLTVQESGNVDV
jgi:hypothetical protein